MSTKPSQAKPSASTECPDCAALRRESAQAIGTLRKELDALKARFDDLGKVKCACGAVATGVTRVMVGAFATNKATCDQCSKARAA